MNALFLLLAVFVALLSIAGSVWLDKRYPDTRFSLRLLFLAIVGFAGVIGASVVGVALGADFFGLIHIFYLVGTISVPMLAAFLVYTATQTKERILVALPLLLVPLGFYMSFIEPFWLRVDEVILETDAASSDLRIGVLADLQTIEVGEYETRAIDELLAQELDMVLIPGDFWQLSFDDFQDVKSEFAGAMAKLSENVDHVVAVHGNTDSIAGLRDITQGTDVVVLNDEVVSYEIKGRTVAIGGVSLWEGTAPQLATVAQLAGQDQDALTILLSHVPDAVFGVADGDTVDLVVAGHTHGGQVSVPFIGPLITFTDVPRNIAAGGLGSVNGHDVYVSTGVGRERGQAPQMRFGVRPSVGVIITVEAE